MILETRINEYNIKQKPKPKKDYADIGAIIFTFTVMSIVIPLSIYTASQIAYGQEIIPIKQKHNSETKDDNDKPKTLEEQKADLDKDYPDDPKILMNYTDGKQEWISLPNSCIEYKSDFYDGHAEVQIHKHSYAIRPLGQLFFIPCDPEHWRDLADYFMKQGWTISSDFEDNIFLRGPALK